VENTIASSTDDQTRSKRLIITFGYYAAFIALGLTTASLGPTLQNLADNTHSKLNEVSYLFTARSLGYLIGSLLGGRLYDRIKGHRVAGAVLLVMALTLALAPFIPVLWLLTFDLLILGIGEGALDVGGNTLLVWLHRDKVGPFMNGLHFFFGVGAFLSPVIIAQAILHLGSFAWGYGILAVLVVIPALWLPPLPSPVSQAQSEGRAPDRINYLLVGLIALFFFLYVGAESSYGGWIFTYATALKLADVTRAAYLTSAFWGALTVGRLLAIPIAARFRPGQILLADLLGCVISLAIILAFPGSLAATWIGTLGVGVSMASAFPTMISLAGTWMATTGQITSFFFVGASTGGMFLPWVIGQLFEPVGPRVTILAILVNVVLDIAVLAVLRQIVAHGRAKGG